MEPKRFWPGVATPPAGRGSYAQSKKGDSPAILQCLTSAKIPLAVLVLPSVGHLSSAKNRQDVIDGKVQDLRGSGT